MYSPITVVPRFKSLIRSERIGARKPKRISSKEIKEIQLIRSRF